MPTSLRSSRSGPMAVLSRCKRILDESGFKNRKGTRFWRRTNVKYDILAFEIVSPMRCQRWNVPVGSFGLEASCLFPFLPRLGYRPEVAARGPEVGFGQIRLGVFRDLPQRPLARAPNLWWVGNEEAEFSAVATDVYRKIVEELFPLFSRFDDTNELLRTLLEDEDAFGGVGPWEFGNKESMGRLLYTGFAAIELGNREIAISSFKSFEFKVNSSPDIIRKRHQSEFLPLIKEGIDCVMAGIRWNWT